MTADQKINVIEWLKGILLAFEDFFHQIQAWFEGTIMEQDWFKNLTSGTDADEETTA